MDNKFLDREGLKTLWSQVSLNDYPNNDMLMAVIEAIDETKADKDNTLLLIGQTLTEEQKQQVKRNLGITEQNSGGDNNEDITPPNTDPITTEYIYTYDGDKESDAHSWITNYGNIKVFAKLGDLPEGELNLVGSKIFRTNPSNQWLDRTFTITEEHLTKVLTKSSTEIPAVQDGLIQIFDMMGSDFSEFTVLCICTQPGWYNVTFDDWYEIIEFKETGIFGYDKRTYGGNDYLKTFTFTATVTPSTGGSSGNGSTGGGSSVPVTPVTYGGNEIQIFSRGICIGDSVTDGSFDNDAGGAVIRRFSYPAILERITNIDIANAGIAGATSGTWYDASLNSDDLWGKWFNNEWVWNTNPTAAVNDVVSSQLDYSGFEFAVIHLGINDLGLMDANTTLEQTVATFETNINKIITKLKENNRGIKIFIATIIPSYASATNGSYMALNNKIKEIANGENIYLLDLNKYSKIASESAYNRIHPTALGYHKLANEIASYISYIIANNLDDFEAVQYIGTNYN